MAGEHDALPITIAILAWRSGDVLRRTLDTYAHARLFDMVRDVVLVFQDMTDDDIAIAQHYGIPYIGFQSNVGIGEGFLAACRRPATQPCILLLEHDWHIVEPPDVIRQRLSAARAMLLDGIDVVRLRHRVRPGEPNYARNAYDQNVSPHLLCCVHWIDRPDLTFPHHIRRTPDGQWYRTTSEWANFTNNPCMYRTSWYIDVVTPFARLGRLLEPEISAWWSTQSFSVVAGEGLFMHCDFHKYPT